MGRRGNCTWDDDKEAVNKVKHGYAFGGLTELFDGRYMLVRQDTRRDYGEGRFNGLPVAKNEKSIMPKNPPPERPNDGTDWVRIAAMNDQEIERNAADDLENPATAATDWAEATVGLPPRKTPVNAMFDIDVVTWFKAQGRGYQTRMNAVLRRYMEVQRKAP